MSAVSRQELERILGSDGTRVHFDLSEDLFEHVRLIGFNSGTFSASEIIFVGDCSPHERQLLKAALMTNTITHRPCKVGGVTLKIAVLC